MVTIEHLAMWLSPLALLATIANILWTWVAQGRAATASKVAELETKQDEHERRIQSLESEMKHVPTRQEISELKLQLSDLLGQLRVSEAEMKGAVRTIQRIEDHMREVRT